MIWCVEDDSAIRDIEMYALQSMGFQVRGFADGMRVQLTFKEYELLRLFMSHPGVAFTREQLFTEVWGTDYYGETRTLDAHIRTLRQKLGIYGNKIETVRNVGDRMEKG